MGAKWSECGPLMGFGARIPQGSITDGMFLLLRVAEPCVCSKPQHIQMYAEGEITAEPTDKITQISLLQIILSQSRLLQGFFFNRHWPMGLIIPMQAKDPLVIKLNYRAGYQWSARFRYWPKQPSSETAVVKIVYHKVHNVSTFKMRWCGNLLNGEEGWHLRNRLLSIRMIIIEWSNKKYYKSVCIVLRVLLSVVAALH